MNRNYGFLLAGSAMFGLGFGIYEFALPYFLDAHGISMGRMGIIYSAAALLTFALWVYTGDLSDRVGRKALYVASLVTTSVASGLTPLAPIFAAQIALKSIREAGGKVFDSMYQLALHDEGQSRYVDRVGKARGLQAPGHSGGSFRGRMAAVAAGLSELICRLGAGATGGSSGVCPGLPAAGQ